MKDFSADVKLAQNGDSEAFSRLYSAVYEDMYHIALYSLRSPHDAADAVSDTVLDAFCSVKKLREPNNFRRWIISILAAKIKRKQKDYYRNDDELDDNFALTDDFSYDSIELKEALGRLDSESKLLLSMSVLGGYSSDEIAEICKLNANTVRSRLSRIKQRLRMELTAEA